MEKYTKLVNKNVGYYYKCKRIIDIVLAILALFIFIPVILVIALLIMIDSPGNPFYTQKRLGLMGKEFTLFKLRTMKKEAEKDGMQWAQKDDPRVTKVGRFLRKTRMDELPQLLNIVLGDMVIIGPRPERKPFVDEFTKEFPRFPERMEVKPGLTGWAQIHGGYNIMPGEKLKRDLYYIEHVSFKMDAYIFVQTIKIVLTGDGAR